MDKEQEELQFLGFLGIYNESCKLIYSYHKIFTKITLTLILPLSFIFLSNIEFSHLLFNNIIKNETDLDRTTENTARHHYLLDLVIKDWVYFIIFKVIYFTFYLILSLLSTSMVAYTVASIFTALSLSFEKVMSVVYKVWKRVIITLLYIFLALVAFNAIAVGVAASLITIVNSIDVDSDWIIILLMIIFWTWYSVGFIYLMLVLNLACVVSVLEESYGIQAMMKSRKLIQGKLLIAMAVFFKLYLSSFGILYLFEWLVVDGYWESVKMVDRVIYAVLFFLLYSMLKLFELVIQTVIYFVCKSYHHENIDKTALSNHLEVYLLAEYVPLNAKDIQLEEYHV